MKIHDAIFKNSCIRGLLGLVIVAVCCHSSSASDAPKELTFSDRDIEDKWNAWPDDVRALFAPFIKSATITKLKYKEHNSCVLWFLILPPETSPVSKDYEVHAKNKLNGNYKLKFNTKKKLEFDSIKIDFSELPAAILAAAKKSAPEAQWNDTFEVEKKEEWTRVVYEITGRVEKKKLKLKFYADGTVAPEHGNK